MHPQYFMADLRIDHGPASVDQRHKDRPHIRRSQRQKLELQLSLHDAPHGPADAPIPAVPEVARQRALLIELAADPRFKRGNSDQAQRRRGFRVKIGQALMRLGWLIVSQGGQSPKTG